MSIGRGGAMEAKCLAIAHAELGGIAVHRAAHRRPHLLENRTMTSNMMGSPPVDRAHLACQEESWACATVLCGMQRGKGDGGQVQSSEFILAKTRTGKPAGMAL